ncbi:MAG: BamA/TamA family outer membrane protein [bacterium]|nr:BamA/TamA family outer membrane protein [bacterium]
MLLIFSDGAGALLAQSPGRIPGGGPAHWKINSVDHGEWRVLDSLHFRIHYPAGLEDVAERAAFYSEQSHLRLSRVLRHRMSTVIPVFLFASHQDFAAGNFFADSPGEGTGGFTDFSRRRVVVPFTGDFAALRHVLAHEIVHAFQFDILPGPFYGGYPLWMIEGMAEYLTVGWDAEAETYVRDLVLHARLPGIGALQSGRHRSAYDHYKVGQAAFWYLARRFGEERIGFFLKEAAATGGGDLRAAFRTAFATTPEEFDFAFAADLNARYAPAFRQIDRESADFTRNDPRLRVASFRYHPDNHASDRTGFHLHPVLSPDGRRLAYLTASGPFPALAVKAAPGPGVSRSEVDDVTIVLRALRSSDYESYQPLTTRVSWSPDGRRLLVAGRRAGRAALLLVDIESEKIVRTIRPPFSAIHFPVFAKDGRRLVFTGVARGQADLYVLDLGAPGLDDTEYKFETPEQLAPGLLRLTDDRCYETDPAFAADGRGVYYSANCAGSRDDASLAGPLGERSDRHIFRAQIPGSGQTPVSSPTRITALPGGARHPRAGVDGSLIISSDFTGVRNAYRIPGAALTRALGGEGIGDDRQEDAGLIQSADLIALTRSITGIEHVALTIVSPENKFEFESDSETRRQPAPPAADRPPPPAPGEYLVFTERSEGALEMMVLPPGVALNDAPGSGASDPLQELKVTAVETPPLADRSFDPAAYRMPIALTPFAWADAPDESGQAPKNSEESFEGNYLIGREYEPVLSFDGVPYLFVGGGTDADGATRIAGLVAARLADDTGDHQIFGLAGYGESPPEWTVDLRYSYLRYRPDFFVGGFRESGAFPVATFFDLNLNNVLYDPNFRVLDQSSYGAYGGAVYPLSKFASIAGTIEAGAEETLFRPRESGQRDQEDISTKYYSAGLALRYSNTVFGPYGPFDGQALLLAYTIPIRPGGDEREVYSLIGDYRLHHWFPGDSVFAARAFAGGNGGQDALDYPFRLGGFATIRGYDFQEFEGRYAFFGNLEFRFPLVKYLLFGFPFDWSPGWIRGVVFFDGGGAFDRPEDWQAYESRTRATRDLYLSYGAGVHFENLLWFLFPGVVMKVEWATPYDLKTGEPPRKWRGVFSLGVNF